MADVPYPITGTDLEEITHQVREVIRNLYEEKIGGADLGDVFSITGDILTLETSSTGGLTKAGNVLAIDAYSLGGMQIDSNGLSIKLVSTGGLETSASGLGIKLDGASLTLSASGIKLTDPLTITSVTLDNDGLHILDTDDSHDLIISPGSDLSADRTLTIVTGDSNRTLTLADDFDTGPIEGMIYYQRSV